VIATWAMPGLAVWLLTVSVILLAVGLARWPPAGRWVGKPWRILAARGAAAERPSLGVRLDRVEETVADLCRRCDRLEAEGAEPRGGPALDDDGKEMLLTSLLDLTEAARLPLARNRSRTGGAEANP
jgi:hypothetical protein